MAASKSPGEPDLFLKKSCSDASRGKYCSGGFSFSLADKALYEVLGFPAFGLLFFFFYPGKLL